MMGKAQHALYQKAFGDELANPAQFEKLSR
jgi:hypothetical protein